MRNVKLQSMRRWYELFQLDKNDTVVTYASKIQNLMLNMESCGEVMVEKMEIEKIIMTVTSHFYHVIIDI